MEHFENCEKMKIHKLKTWPIFFQAILDGTKTFEFRLNDRRFQVGDKLDLMEYDPDAEGYTGRHCHRFVSYVLDANPFFDFKGHVILGLKPVEIPEITERFKKPTDKQLVEIALLFNDGKLQKSKLRDMIAMCEFILDRLYENNDVMKPSSKE